MIQIPSASFKTNDSNSTTAISSWSRRVLQQRDVTAKPKKTNSSTDYVSTADRNYLLFFDDCV